MALDTYDALLISVRDWLARPNLISIGPDLVRLAEARLQREVRCRHNQVFLDSVVLDAQRVAVPDDFIDIEAMVTTTPRRGLVYESPEILLGRAAYGESGEPQWVTIIGDEFHLAPAPTSDVPYLLVYYKRVPALGSSVQTNWLLDAAPDLYLWSALAEAEPYLKNDPRIATWQTKKADALALLNGNDRRMRSRGLGQRVRPV